MVQGFPSRAFLKQRFATSSASAKTIPAFQHQTAATNILWTGGQVVKKHFMVRLKNKPSFCKTVQMLKVAVAIARYYFCSVTGGVALLLLSAKSDSVSDAYFKVAVAHLCAKLTLT